MDIFDIKHVTVYSCCLLFWSCSCSSSSYASYLPGASINRGL